LSLSHKLLLGMLLFTTLGLIFGFVFINTLVRNIVHESILESAYRDRMIHAQHMDAWFEEAVQIITNLSETLPLVNRSHYQDVVVHYFNRYDFIQALWITKADGGFYDSGFWEPPYWFVSQDRDWWIMSAARSGSVITTPPYISASTGEIWTAISRHTYGWHGQETTVTMAVEFTQLEAMINDFQSRTEGYLMLTTPDGGFVIHPNPDYLPSEDGLHTILTRMSEHDNYREIFNRFQDGEAVIEGIDRYGIASYFMRFELPSTNWYLIAVIPTTVTSVPVMQILSVVMFIIIFALATVGVFSFFFAKWIATTMARKERGLEREARLVAEESNKLLSRLNQLRTKFMADISHEMRTPLTVIDNYAQLTDMEIDAGDVSADTKKNLMTISTEAQRLANLTSRLLDIAEAQDSGAKGIEVSVHDVFSRVLSIYNPIVAANRNRIENIIETNCPTVRAIPDMLMQVLFNLIGNANRHTKKDIIRLTAQPDAKMVIFKVIDNGSGMPADILEKVFQRGVSGDGSSGLGLNICKEAIESHGGTISIESEPGIGTIVTFALPIYT